MHDWKINKTKRGSSTAGKSKGENCQADWMKKYYMTGARAYKDAGQYATYCEMSRRLVYNIKSSKENIR